MKQESKLKSILIIESDPRQAKVLASEYSSPDTNIIYMSTPPSSQEATIPSQFMSLLVSQIIIGSSIQPNAVAMIQQAINSNNSAKEKSLIQLKHQSIVSSQPTPSADQDSLDQAPSHQSPELPILEV